MNFSIRETIQACVAPEHRLSCSKRLWVEGLSELRRRGKGVRESGAFLLGKSYRRHRRVEQFVYYDDLDPACLDTGIIVFDGSYFGQLWTLCRARGLAVVADIHTHPDQPWQSPTYRENPMVALAGHLALIVPDFAQREVAPAEIAVYEYLGAHQWRALNLF